MHVAISDYVLQQKLLSRVGARPQAGKGTSWKHGKVKRTTAGASRRRPFSLWSGVLLEVLAVRMVPVAGFLQMVFQLLFRLAAALAHNAHLLGCWCRVGVQVRAWIMRALGPGVAHTHIVPLRRAGGKVGRALA